MKVVCVFYFSFLFFFLFYDNGTTLATQVDENQIKSDLFAYLRETDEEKTKHLRSELLKNSFSDLRGALQTLKPSGPLRTGSFPHEKLKVGKIEQDYSLFIPQDYSHQTPQPVVILLHGTGFTGSAYLDRWVSRFGSEFMVVCPTISMGEWWTPGAEKFILALIKELMLNYRLDMNRIFLGGMSSGGVGTLLIGSNHSDLFAGLFPMSGAFPKVLFPLLDNLNPTPMYLLHGSKDRVMPPKFSQGVSKYMKEKKLNVLYREHHYEHPQAGGHFFPEEETQALFKWLAKQTRPSLNQNLSIVHDRDHIGRNNWIRVRRVEDVASFWASYTDRSEGEAIKAGQFARLRGEVFGENRLEITTERIREFEVLLSDQLVNFEKPVVIKVNGSIRFQDIVKPDPRVFLKEAYDWPDPARTVWAVVPISLGSL